MSSDEELADRALARGAFVTSAVMVAMAAETGRRTAWTTLTAAAAEERRMFLGAMGDLFGGDWTRLTVQAPPPASEALLAEFNPADCRIASVVVFAAATVIPAAAGGRIADVVAEAVADRATQFAAAPTAATGLAHAARSAAVYGVLTPPEIPTFDIAAQLVRGTQARVSDVIRHGAGAPPVDWEACAAAARADYPVAAAMVELGTRMTEERAVFGDARRGRVAEWAAAVPPAGARGFEAAAHRAVFFAAALGPNSVPHRVQSGWAGGEATAAAVVAAMSRLNPGAPGPPSIAAAAAAAAAPPACLCGADIQVALGLDPPDFRANGYEAALIASREGTSSPESARALVRLAAWLTRGSPTGSGFTAQELFDCGIAYAVARAAVAIAHALRNVTPPTLPMPPVEINPDPETDSNSDSDSDSEFDAHIANLLMAQPVLASGMGSESGSEFGSDSQTDSDSEPEIERHARAELASRAAQAAQAVRAAHAAQAARATHATHAAQAAQAAQAARAARAAQAAQAARDAQAAQAVQVEQDEFQDPRVILGECVEGIHSLGPLPRDYVAGVVELAFHHGMRPPHGALTAFLPDGAIVAEIVGEFIEAERDDMITAMFRGCPPELAEAVKSRDAVAIDSAILELPEFDSGLANVLIAGCRPATIAPMVLPACIV